MFKLLSLLRNTPVEVINRTVWITGQLLDVSIGSNYRGNFKQVLSVTKTSDFQGTRYHRQKVKFYYDMMKMPGNPEVWLTCDCAYFLYYVEYVLAREGSTSLIYGNGQPPVVRNPMMRPYLCKHLYNIMPYAQKAIPPQWQEQMNLYKDLREEEQVEQQEVTTTKSRYKDFVPGEDRAKDIGKKRQIPSTGHYMVDPLTGRKIKVRKSYFGPSNPSKKVEPAKPATDRSKGKTTYWPKPGTNKNTVPPKNMTSTWNPSKQQYDIIQKGMEPSQPRLFSAGWWKDWWKRLTGAKKP